MFIKKASLHNSADDNTLFAFATDIDDLIENLRDESQKTTDWMILNQMIINPKKLQDFRLQVNNTEITIQSSFELQGVTIDNGLKFDQHINRLRKSAG